MENNILCFLNVKIEEINLKKLGIKFRNINNEEIKYIMEKIKDIYCSKEIIDLFNKYQKIKNIDNNEKNIDKIKEAVDTYKEIQELDYKKRNAFFYLEENKGKINIENVEANLKNCIIVELDESLYKECFGIWDIKSVISRIINFSNYLGNEFKPMNFQMTEIKNFDNYEQIINNIENTFDSKTLKKITQLLNSKDINFNANFVFMIENFLIEGISYENKIINMISIIEKLLINKQNNKQENFILKVGVLIYKDVEWDNDKISKVLKAIYEFRSMLVHGKEDEIYENKTKYADVFEDNKLKSITEKIELRYEILSTISDCLEKITKLVLNEYFDNVDFCDFLKSN